MIWWISGRNTDYLSNNTAQDCRKWMNLWANNDSADDLCQSVHSLPAVSWPAMSSSLRLWWLFTAWKLSFHISQMMLLQRGLTLWKWIFNRQSHVFNYYIRHFCARMFCASPLRPPHFPPPSSSSHFPISPGTTVIASPHCIPKLSHAVFPRPDLTVWLLLLQR